LSSNMVSRTPASMMHSSLPKWLSDKFSVSSLHKLDASAMTMLFMPVLERRSKLSMPMEFSDRSRWVRVVLVRDIPRKQMALACRWFCERWSSWEGVGGVRSQPCESERGRRSERARNTERVALNDRC